MILNNSTYYLTNGIFEGGFVKVGTSFPGHFNQYGGTAIIDTFNFYVAGGSYSLFGGILNSSSNLNLYVDDNGSVSFLQAGGTNHAQNVMLGSGFYGWGAGYTLNDGLLSAGNLSVLSGGGLGTFEQNGGVTIVTNTLFLYGSQPTGGNIKPANYFLNGGSLITRLLSIGDEGSFNQSNGIASIYDTLNIGGSVFNRWHSSLSGGTLACSNVTYNSGGEDFNQSGGSFIVTNLLSYGGEIDMGHRHPKFTLTGGIFAASNI
jgi:hypothetical protein